MSSGFIVFLEFVLVSGLVLGFGIWQIVSLDRERKKTAAATEDRDEKADRAR